MDIQKTLSDRQIIHPDPETMSGAPVSVGTRVLLQTLFDQFDSANFSLHYAATAYPESERLAE